MKENFPMPNGLSKKQITDMLLYEEYGFIPEKERQVSADITDRNESFCAGKADLVSLVINTESELGKFSFPAYYVCPKGKKNVPLFIHINFRDLIPDKYQPTEEIIDRGYAVMTFCYKDVTSDDGDFSNGIADVWYRGEKRDPHAAGKISMWAWAAMRLADYAETLPEIDKSRIFVVGHSRLGKTALLAGALDDRFACAFSNDSGCSGAAVSRGKNGETIRDICNKFDYWFCENYIKYVDNEDLLPFDQHFLLAANVGHKVYVASAKEDLWSDPDAEFLSCRLACDYFKANGQKAMLPEKNTASPGDFFHGGDIGYHIRSGKHYLSREDWKLYMDYLENENRQG